MAMADPQTGKFIIRVSLRIPEGTPLSTDSVTLGVIEGTMLVSLLQNAESIVELRTALGGREFQVNNPPPPTQATGAADSGLPLAAIAGGAAGGVIVLLLIIVVVCIYKSVYKSIVPLTDIYINCLIIGKTALAHSHHLEN